MNNFQRLKQKNAVRAMHDGGTPLLSDYLRMHKPPAKKESQNRGFSGVVIGVVNIEPARQ